jgi:hypothetical protein
MFRFTIRDVLWLTVVVGLSLSLSTGYLAYRRQLAAWEEERFEWLHCVADASSQLAKASGEAVVIKAPRDKCVLTVHETGKMTLSPGSAWRFRDARIAYHAVQKLKLSGVRHVESAPAAEPNP